MKKKLLLLMIPVVVGTMLVACDEHEAVITPIETLSPTKVASMVYTPPPTPTPTPTAEIVEYVTDPVDVEYIAKTLWGEARGIESDMEKAAVAWCILNRVDNERWGDTVEEVVTQPNQFHGYHPSYPVTDELREIAEDVLVRWAMEKETGEIDGRVLPSDYYFFASRDDDRNYFRKEYEDRTYWDWSMDNPYED